MKTPLAGTGRRPAAMNAGDEPQTNPDGSIDSGDGRVDAREVADVLDAIVGLLRVDHPGAVYRYLGRRAGVNATTLLRYHHGLLDTAPRRVYKCLADVRDEIAAGYRPPLGGRAWKRRNPSRVERNDHDRVPAGQVRGLVEELRLKVEVPPNVVIREAARELGMHCSTVFRLASGRLATAPRALVAYLDGVRRRVQKGDVPVFHRAKTGVPVVPRGAVVKAMDAIFRRGLFTMKTDLFKLVDRATGLPLRHVAQAYYGTKTLFVDASIYRMLEAILKPREYNPNRTYKVGDGVRHPVFGAGVVVEKLQNDKIEVAFGRFGHRVLRENLIADDLVLQAT
jgi:hypothetical protein